MSSFLLQKDDFQLYEARQRRSTKELDRMIAARPALSAFYGAVGIATIGAGIALLAFWAKPLASLNGIFKILDFGIKSLMVGGLTAGISSQWFAKARGVQTAQVSHDERRRGLSGDLRINRQRALVDVPPGTYLRLLNKARNPCTFTPTDI